MPRHLGRLQIALLAAAAGLASWGCPDDPPPEACTGKLAGDVVISEYMADPPGIDSEGEWFELYNATGKPLELKGLTLSIANPDGSDEKIHVMRSGSVAAGGYFVVGSAPEATKPSFVSYSYADALGTMSSTGSRLLVRCGTTVLDQVATVANPPDGKSRSLNGKLVPDSANNDTEPNWCESTEEFAPGMFGSPGALNEICLPAGNCRDATGNPRPMVIPNPGDLVITEFMANPSAVGDTEGEFIEIYATATADLNGLVISNGSGQTINRPSTCQRLTQGSYAVFVRKTDAAINGGISNANGTFGFSLLNSNGSLSLKTEAGAVIDQISYTATSSGASTQLDPGKLSATSNDDPNAFCASTASYGAGDKGTPGAANATCPPVVDPNSCTDPTTQQQRPIVRPAAGELVISEFMANPNAVADEAGEWIELYATAPIDLNGVVVANSSSSTTLSKPECMRLTQGSYAVLVRNADSGANGGIADAAAIFGFGLVNSSATGATLSLKDNAGVVIDQLSYMTTATGASTQVDPAKLTAQLNDDPASACPGTQTYGAGDKGTPGAANLTCPPVVDPNSCTDPATQQSRPIVRPAAGDLVITEVMANPKAVSDTSGEWFELLVKADVDLNGLELTDDASTSRISSTHCVRPGAGQYVVFAHNVDAAVNGGLPLPAGIFTYALGNTGAKVLAVKSEGVELDRIGYTAPATEGVSLQLSVDKLDTTANDDPASFCPTQAKTYGTAATPDKGSPGAENETCPTAP